jgi:signal transduction histidine kinase
VAVQTALAVTVVVMAMSGVVLLIDEQQQHRQAEAASRDAWADADDVTDPPAGVWLVIAGPGGGRDVTPGAPAAVRGLDPRSLPDGVTRVVRSGRELTIRTGDRDIGRVSAVYDLSPAELQERRLLLSLGVAGLVGVLGAAAVGAVIGRKAVRPLGEAIALQRRFVADASHELRTPLTVLATRAQLVRRHLKGTAGPEQDAELDRLVRDASTLGEVVTDLLLAAELQRWPHRADLVDVAALAGEVSESLRPLAAERGVDLSATLPDTTPRDPDESPVPLVCGIEAALRRAVTSLVDNAIAHTAPGGHVVVGVHRDAGSVLVAVVDDGEGLDPKEAGRLVARFARGTSGEPGRRFGLGLALVDEVARAHHGTLLIDGVPGAGAAFTLKLPSAS